MKNLICLVLVSVSIGCTAGLGGSSITDVTASGAAASSVGAAMNTSSSSGTTSRYSFPKLIESAFASTACPTLRTTGGVGCSNTSGVSILAYSNCSFGSSQATWSGTLGISLGTGALTCGTFPTVIGTTLNRQFVTSGSPSSGTRTSAKGEMVTIDHSSANLSNYQSATIATNINSGYGSQVTFSGAGVRTGVMVRQRLYATSFDHSIDGSVTVSEASGSRTVSGAVTVWHNKAKVKGTTTFSNVVYNDSCCNPVSGSLTTAFAATSATPNNVVANALVNTSETLVITGCGTANLTSAGVTIATTLDSCY